ncbi:MAG: LamG domain-containing protein, partial [Planctomycetes bacterium]|nr:LamG domain-containing protein [Planctomycetota bacterium]
NSVDTTFGDFGTFTIEAFIKPDRGMTVLSRLLYIAQVDYDRGWTTANDADDGNVDSVYLVMDGDPGPYEFGGNFYQANGILVGAFRYGASNRGWGEYWTPPGEWHHVGVTADSINITTWVNGHKIESFPYDGTIRKKLDADDGLRISSVFYNRSFSGLMDEVVFSVLPKGTGYMRSQALKLPLGLAEPGDGAEFVSVDQPLRWKRIKGPFLDTQYEVYMGTAESGPEMELVATTSDLSFKPTLVNSTEYSWYVKPIPVGKASEVRSFRTAPLGFEGLLGHWTFDEG